LLDAAWVLDSAPLTHQLGDASLQQSAGAFFQTSPQYAWDAFSVLLAQWGLRGSALYDIYGGGGFFSAMLRGRFAQFVLVESSAQSCGDARTNLAGLDARIFQADAEAYIAAQIEASIMPGANSIAILDPPRKGLPPALCDALHAWRPDKLVLIGCDGASFCRDATRLSRSWRLDQLAAIDLFPNTSHVECVGLFE
jgi:tRNA/tmRNA/rRNA uracil-C5-methylase (TrmA/RlmC/RlmD family)